MMAWFKIWTLRFGAFNRENTPDVTVLYVSTGLLSRTIADVGISKVTVIGYFYVVCLALFLLFSILQQLVYAELLEGLQYLLLSVHQSVSYPFFCCAVVLARYSLELSQTFMLTLKIVTCALTPLYLLRCRVQLFY